jgi:hypothetical protein
VDPFMRVAGLANVFAAGDKPRRRCALHSHVSGLGARRSPVAS